MSEETKMQVDDPPSAISGIIPSLTSFPCSSFYRSVPAPALLLTPTVGSRVVFDPKHCKNNRFIWEEKGVDFAYLRCAAQHMLVGHVLRETDTQLVVHFEIPYHCLPSGLLGCGARRHGGGKKYIQGGNNKVEVDEIVKNDAVENNNDNNNNNNKAELDVGDHSKENEETQEVNQDVYTRATDTMLQCGEYTEEGDVALYLRSPRFVAGIVPVLALTHDNTLLPTVCSRAKAVTTLDDACGTEQSTCSGVGNSYLQRQFSASYHSGSVSTLTTSFSSVPEEYFPGVLRVSLSVLKCFCTTLLQSILEQHNKLDSVVTAVACCDFKLAVQHIKAVIVAQHSLVIQLSEECKNMDNSGQASSPCLQPRHSTPDTDTNWSTDTFFQKYSSSHPVVESWPGKDGLTKRSEAQNIPIPQDEENKQRTETLGEKPVNRDKFQALRLWKNANAQRTLAPLYSLLSFVYFHNKQYKESLEEAKIALAHDKTFVEGYTRAMASLMALDLPEKALEKAAVAIKCCITFSPQFVRLSQVACVCSFYGRTLGEHSVVDVLPRGRRVCSLGEPESVRDASMAEKANRSAPCSMTVHLRKFNFSSASPTSVFCVAPVSVRNLLPGLSPPMDYFSRNLRARAAREFDINEIVFSEEVSLQVMLWTPADFEFEATPRADCSESGCDRSRAWALCRSRFCAYCGHPLVSKQLLLAEVCEKMSRAMANQLRVELSEKRPLSCLAGCGDYYCNEICRNRAAVEYHLMECHLFFEDEDKNEIEERQVECNNFLTQEAFRMRDGAPPPLASREGDSTVHHAASVSFSSLPLDRLRACQLVNIRRRQCQDRRRSSLSFPELYAESQCLSGQYGSATSSTTSQVVAERERRYLRLLRVCRFAIQGIRVAFKAHYAAIKTVIADKAPIAMIVGLLVMGRLVASVLSLILPAASLASEVVLGGSNHSIEPEYVCRERSTALKAIIRRYVSRGFTSSGASPSDRHDAHGLALAEEVLHEIRVPFFADTNVVQPTTVWELLGENPPKTKRATDDAPSADSETAKSQNIRCGFDCVEELLNAINKIVQTQLHDEAVALSFSLETGAGRNLDPGGSGSLDWANSELDDINKGFCENGKGFVEPLPLISDAGSLYIWLAEEQCEYRVNVSHRPSVWTFGRLLGFLGKQRFMEQLWDFCLSSYSVVPKCVLSAGVCGGVPEHQQEGWEQICQRYTVLLAVMGPLTSVVTDLSAFGGGMCSRFFSDIVPHDARNPLCFLKNDSPTMSILSINSLPHELDEVHSWASGHNMGGSEDMESPLPDLYSATATTIGNVRVCDNDISNRSGERRVTMRAQRSIAVGEELIYEYKPC